MGQASGGRVKSLLTGSMVTTLGTGNMLLSVNYYDLEGRLVQLKSKNHLGGEDIIDNTYNFAGELTASTRSHTIGGNTNATVIANRYAYDHMGRKMASMESINGQPEVVLNKTEYNVLGQLLRKNLHSTDNDQSYLQHSDYVYNERGWMKTSTSNEFSLELQYNAGTNAQWNGNISAQVWKRGTEAENTFSYQYDRLNRLTNAISPNLGEVITYDEMGNIQSLKRDGFGTNTYSGYNGKQLIKIEGFTNSTYTHDGNGNLTSDSGKGITSIAYNYLNLPAQVSGTMSVTYTYDSRGKKLRKNSLQEKTDYIDGIQHKADGSIDFIITEDGLARNNAGIYSYEYTLSDHLGNNRSTFYKNPGNNQLQVLQQDDYYAFGLPKSRLAGSNENKYLYNGKELQKELGELDYGARFYDPVIGRWNVVDPLAEKNRRFSPYVYGNNNPIRFIDPDGMQASDWVYGKNGEVRWDETVNKAEDVKKGSGDTYIGKTGTYTSKEGNTVQLHDKNTLQAGERSWDYVTPETQNKAAGLTTDEKGAVDGMSLVVATAEAGIEMVKDNPIVSEKLVENTSRVLGSAGKLLGVTSALNDALTIRNKGFSNATYADWTKLGVSTGMLFVKSNPYTIGFSIVYGLADMTGYNPIDLVYKRLNTTGVIAPAMPTTIIP